MDIIGLLPCGGLAKRILPLPLSKELYPIGWQSIDESNYLASLRPKVVSHYLLEKMKLAIITHVYFILRSGKWDIPNYFGDGSWLDLNLGYLIMNLPYGVPYTLNQAYPFVQGKIIALGFPDILLQPEDIFGPLLRRQASHQADVVVGLFPTNQSYKASMVDFEPDGRVKQIVEKPTTTDLVYMWGNAVWSPKFTHFLHAYVKTDLANRGADPASHPELPISTVIQAAIADGLQVEAEVFANGSYLDIGTPGDLVNAVSSYGKYPSRERDKP